MSLAIRTYDMGADRYNPGDQLGIVELVANVAPEDVCRAMLDGLIILERIEDSSTTKKQLPKKVTHGRNPQ